MLNSVAKGLDWCFQINLTSYLASIQAKSFHPYQRVNLQKSIKFKQVCYLALRVSAQALWLLAFNP